MAVWDIHQFGWTIPNLLKHTVLGYGHETDKKLIGKLIMIN
jgi:hypothetical protein